MVKFEELREYNEVAILLGNYIVYLTYLLFFREESIKA